MTAFYRVDEQYFPIPTSDLVEDLPPGIYQLNFHPMKGVYLKRFGEKFRIPNKIYGEKIRRRVNKINDLFERSSNSAVLLIGTKGTGKTLSSKKICNDFIEKGYKVILYESGLPASVFKTFLNSDLKKAIILFDEFDKTVPFSDNDDNNRESLTQVDLLTILDGSYTNLQDIHFIFTANNISDIRDEFLSRPSRIKYTMIYDGLDMDTIKEIFDDRLPNLELNSFEEKISILANLNFDLILSLAEELKLGYSFEETIEDFGLIKGAVQLTRLKFEDKEIIFKDKVLIPKMNDRIEIFFSDLVKYVDDVKDKELIEELDQKFYDWIIKQDDIISFDLKTGKKIYRSKAIEIEIY